VVISNIVLVVAPHPDDETLGCGGTLLRHLAQGDRVHWLILTKMDEQDGYSLAQIQQRKLEIQTVAQIYGFESIVELSFRASTLDVVPLAELVKAVAGVFVQVKPDTVYLPYRYDAHSDHACAFDAVSACSKSFRYPFIKQVLAYETLSETGYALSADAHSFNPNTWVCIDDYLEQKLSIMTCYASEIADFPFPRSLQTMRSLAHLRGSQANCYAAEAFMLLKSIR
jgi:LmbE family N-acetylglucosaminyl deacetylase